MEKSSKTILSLIISCFVAYSLIVPTSYIFGLEDSTGVNGSVEPSDSSQSVATKEQTSKDTAQDVEATSKSEPQKADDANSEQGSSKQTEQTEQTAKDSSDSHITRLSKQSEQTTKASSSTDITPPGRVRAILVKAVSDNQIDLKWTGVKDSDLNHYNVYMGTKSSFKVSPGATVPSGTSNTNSYSSTGLNPSTRYYYKIAAVDDANNVGPLSSTKTGMTKGAATSTQHDIPSETTKGGATSTQHDIPSETTKGGATSTQHDIPTQELTGLSPSSTITISSTDTTAPAQVTGLVITTASSTQLNLAWTRVTASDFNHYNIYRGISGFTVTPGVTVPTGTSSTNSYSNTGLNPSTKYSYRVAAVDNAGNIGALSSQVSKTTAASTSTSSSDTTPPARVTGLVITTASSTQLNLAWTRVTASDFNHYNIYRGISGFTVTPGVTVPTGTSSTNSYSNTGLNPSTKYSYRVAAVDNAGNIGVLSSQVSKTTAASSSSDTTPPARVTGLVITTASSTQLNLAWTRVTASDFNHYNIYRGTSGFTVTPGVTVPTGTSSTNSYSNTGLNPSTKYSYRVAAVDNAGNIGVLSSQVSKTTAGSSSADTTPPAQVTGLVITTASSTQLNLAWTRVTASDFNHYNIYRGTSGFTVTPGVTVPTGTSTTNSYSNTGLSPSTKYSYRVAAVDNAGNIGPLSSERSSTTNAGPDTTPPAQVTGLSASTISSTQINLGWTQNTESDFNQYLIYRGTSGFTVTPGVTVPTGTSIANAYSSTGLSPSTTYYYKVAAVDNAGNIGPLSSERSSTTNAAPDTTPPAQVTGLSASTISSTQINLGWTQNTESDFNQYLIYRGTSSGFTVTPGVTVPTGTSTTNSYSSTGLSPSTTYYYKVAAKDDAGNIGPLSSERSSTTNAAPDTTPPAQVTGLSASTISSTQINLGWTQNTESDFNQYLIYRGTSSGFTVTPGVTVPTGTSIANAYSSTGLSPSTTYYYKVAAKDDAGNIGPLSSERSSTTNAAPDTTPPAQVTGLSASTISSTQINLGWTQNTESDFNQYLIYRGTSSGFTVTPGVTVPTGTSTTNSYSSTGLSPSTTYYYKVAAVDNAGNIGPLSSERSSTTNAAPDTTPPAQVTGLSASTISSTQINLGWTQNTESDFNQYLIYRGTSSGFTVTPGVTVPTGTSTTNSYSSTGLSPSTTYYYKVAAKDDAGNIGPLSSERSSTTNAAPDTTPPAQVTGLSASTISSTQINLGWTQNTESDFNQYLIYRGTSSGFTVTPGVTVPTGTSTTNSYSSTGLSPSTTYYYKVAAKDDANNIGQLSSEKSGTTSSSDSIFSDNFDTPYNLASGATSPDGKWRDKYIGSGKVASENGVMHMVPKTATGTTDSSGVGYETYAALVLSKQSFKNFQLDFDMKTDKQLRTNTTPNNWETAWIFFRFTDEDPKSNHHYYFLLRKNGYEFGKKDNAPNDNGLEQQIYLKTGTSPSVSIGSFQHVTIIANNFHFTIKVNGNTVVDMDDPHVYDPTKMAQGLLGMYTEDADVSFDNVKLT